MAKTKKSKAAQIELSNLNKSLSYVYVKGVKWHITGTYRTTNGKWMHTIKNTSLPRTEIRHKEVSDIKLKQVINDYESENQHL